jgi:hypothetical protein
MKYLRMNSPVADGQEVKPPTRYTEHFNALVKKVKEKRENLKKCSAFRNSYILHTSTKGVPDLFYRYINAQSIYRALSCIWTYLR